MSSSADLMMLARVAGSLIVVLALVALAARTARRTQWRRSTTGMRVLDRTGLSREASVAVVEVAGRALVLGVTAHGVSVLTVLDPDQVRAEQAGQSAGRSADQSTGQSAGRAARPARSGSTRATAAPTGTSLAGTGLDFAQVAAAVQQRRTGGPERDGYDRALLPPAIKLSEHPDLASALRAAGRVADAAKAPNPTAAQRPADRARPAVPSQPVARETLKPTKRRTGKVSRTPRSTDSRPGSGSVLDPATWRQGLEALRDLTARRR